MIATIEFLGVAHPEPIPVPVTVRAHQRLAHALHRRRPHRRPHRYYSYTATPRGAISAATLSTLYSKPGCTSSCPTRSASGYPEKPPRSTAAHSLDNHTANIVSLLDALDLRHLTFVCHDSGRPKRASPRC